MLRRRSMITLTVTPAATMYRMLPGMPPGAEGRVGALRVGSDRAGDGTGSTAGDALVKILIWSSGVISSETNSNDYGLPVANSCLTFRATV
jgi:hypothetical protein